MRTVARTGTTLLALGAATLLLGACGSDDPEPDVAAVQAAVDEAADGSVGGAAGTVEEGANPGDADVCARYAADGQAFVDAYDYLGSGATDDFSELVAAADALAADIDTADDVSDAVLGTAEEISASAAEVGPALESGAGVEEIDATIGGLDTLASTCAELGVL